MHHQQLIPHLFRTEYRTSETFLSALENWPYKGIPENPVTWLYTVAKNKAKNHLQRNQVFAEKIAKQIKYASSQNEEMEIDLSEKNITDSQLQMLFTLCHPSIPKESQIGLSLRILCGFGIEEIATAFLTNKETINKRLFRAKEKLRIEKVKIVPIAIGILSKKEIDDRLETVLT